MTRLSAENAAKALYMNLMLTQSNAQDVRVVVTSHRLRTARNSKIYLEVGILGNEEVQSLRSVEFPLDIVHADFGQPEVVYLTYTLNSEDQSVSTLKG